MDADFDVIVIGGGHAGVEAAWGAANVLAGRGVAGEGRPARVALVTQDPFKIGVMSCNPAIGGLAKGQMVREIDALGGLMGLATDATGVQFKVLNTSKGAAVRGPRAQCDKHAYAEAVQGMLAARPEIKMIAGSVERLLVEGGRVMGVEVVGSAVKPGLGQGPDWNSLAAWPSGTAVLSARAVVLTTGTFMRGLMHTGEQRTAGGRFGEAAAEGISGALRGLGFELGRLKTGTPPRLRRGTIDWEGLPEQMGDAVPEAFSELSGAGIAAVAGGASLARFPVLEQVKCRITSTSEAVHEHIRANLHRAPMFSGQIEGVGPRYCPSLEDKVVRFADRASHHVYLEPESLRDDWVYCNGISTSLPRDVQDFIVRSLPGCERAEILRYGYAVEYDMVRPHQLRATGESKPVAGLFLAGQINGTSGYEEAAAQGLIAGVNAARQAFGEDLVTLGRHEAFIGVLMDDLATKTPVEPYRMFTSRAEHRVLLRADNAADRLTPRAEEWGMLAGTELGRLRLARFGERRGQIAAARELVARSMVKGREMAETLRRPGLSLDEVRGLLGEAAAGVDDRTLFSIQTDYFYEPFVRKAAAEVRRHSELERKRIPRDFDYAGVASMRSEARAALVRFRPETLGQASRLEGLTPADVMLLSMLIRKHRLSGAGGA